MRRHCHEIVCILVDATFTPHFPCRCQLRVPPRRRRCSSVLGRHHLAAAWRGKRSSGEGCGGGQKILFLLLRHFLCNAAFANLVRTGVWPCQHFRSCWSTPVMDGVFLPANNIDSPPLQATHGRGCPPGGVRAQGEHVGKVLLVFSAPQTAACFPRHNVGDFRVALVAVSGEQPDNLLLLLRPRRRRRRRRWHTGESFFERRHGRRLLRVHRFLTRVPVRFERRGELSDAGPLDVEGPEGRACLVLVIFPTAVVRGCWGRQGPFSRRYGLVRKGVLAEAMGRGGGRETTRLAARGRGWDSILGWEHFVWGFAGPSYSPKRRPRAAGSDHDSSRYEPKCCVLWETPPSSFFPSSPSNTVSTTPEKQR